MSDEVRAYRSTLQQLSEASDPVRFIDAAWPYVNAVPEDPHIASAVVDGLLELGLAAVAREFVKSRRDVDLNAALEERLHSESAGRVAWPALQDRFDRNIATLEQRHEGVVPDRGAMASALRRLHLFRMSSGHWALSHKEAGRPRCWRPALSDYRNEFHVDLPEFASATVVFIDGVSLGPLVERVYAATAETGLNRSVPMIVIEQDAGRFAAWLHIADRSRFLADPRVLCFAGDGGFEAVEAFLSAQDDLWVEHALTLAAPGLAPNNRLLEGIGQRVQTKYASTMETLSQRLCERGRQRDEHSLRQRLQKGGRVIGLTSRCTTMLQYSTRDIGEAFKKLGWDFELVMEPADHRRLGTVHVARRLLEFDPDLILTVNHLRYEYGSLLQDIPMLTWLQDPMPNLLCAEAGASIGPMDYLCGYFRRQCVEEFGYPQQQFVDAVVPVSTTQFHGAPLDARDQSECDADVMYAGHLTATPDSLTERWLEDVGDLAPMVHEIRDRVATMIEQGENIGAEQVELVDDVAEQLGFELDDTMRHRVAHFYAYALFDVSFRLQTLEWVAEWAERTGRNLRLYGNGWADHPRWAPFAVGAVEHGEPLRKAYRGARLVLQTVPSGFRHQRTLEALASGSLVLARSTPRDYAMLSPQAFRAHHSDDLSSTTASARYFPRLDEVLFDSGRGFADLAERYLEDAASRQATAESFQAVVHQEFSYDGQLGRILGHFFD
jgi:hypothetical protein